MARSLFRDTICYRGPAGLIPLSGASVRFYEVDGPGPPTVPIAYPLYPDGVTTVPIPVPYSTGPLGELELWSDLPHRVRILVEKPGLSIADEIIDLDLDPAESATDPEVVASIEAHEAKPNAHPEYATDDDLAFHAAAAEAHPQYLLLTGGTMSGDLAVWGTLTVNGVPMAVVSQADWDSLNARVAALESATAKDVALRGYVQTIMSVIDPGAPPPP